MTGQEATGRKSLGLTPVSLPNSEGILSLEAQLFRWDDNIEEFHCDGIVNAQILKSTDTAYKYWLCASTSAGPLLCHQFSSDMNQRLSRKMKTLTWNNLPEGAVQGDSWLFMFNDEQDYGAFTQAFQSCMWETRNELPWGKVKVRNACILDSEDTC